MASLRAILNPSERKRSVKLLVIPPEQSTSTWEPVSHPSPGSSSEDDPNDYNPLIHIPHPDCPDSLACLPDTDGRPQHTLPVILRCAILGSPRKRLTIREIYAAMEEKYAYYRTAGPTWKQSVRHHLSLNRLFERQPRPATDPGFGSYWTVNLAAPPGTKRPRKRGRPNKDARPKKDDVPEEGTSSKPRRGRPRKDDSPVPVAVLVAESTLPIVPLIQPPIEPPIDPLVEAPLQGEDEGDVNMLTYEDELVDELESHTSGQEDECESEEKLLHPFERRHSLSGGLTPYDSSAGFHFPPQMSPDNSFHQILPLQIASPPQLASPPRLSPPKVASPRQISPNYQNASPTLVASPRPHASPQLFASPQLLVSPQPLVASPRQMSPLRGTPQSFPDSADSEEIIERLQMEMANLRRQSAEAISISMRLSDQLAQAQAEVSQIQSALEAMETRMREETNRRRQAEREADDAVRLRHAAEEALKSMRFHSELSRLAR
ncbi:hypothetical protein B0H19DRAFT_1128434 [Mycena capillaripes]|nr:hypothetical protein B0H19DRAFT_1128434 [Mycena capillaripes]